MEDRKLRRNMGEVPKVEKKKKTPLEKLNLVSKILSIVLTILVVTVFSVLIYLKVFPKRYLIPLGILILGLDIAGIITVFRKKTGAKTKFVLSIIISIFILIFGFITLKLMKTLNFLGKMDTSTVNAKTYSVVVLNNDKYKEMKDLNYKMLMYYDTELETNKAAVEKLKSVITIVPEKIADVHELAKNLIDEKTDAILIEESYYPIIEEEIADFKEKTKVIYTFSIDDTIDTIAKEVSVTKEPFVIYISGIDTYGKISSVARSDVNMIVVVNPTTKQVLLINTPRDYYVKLHGTTGYRDKLTHAGIYGIDMSVKTLEDLYETDINYYVRVNFTSLIKVIDAIGGVDVYSKYSFTSKVGKYNFTEGYNHLDGKKALGFARERYSFSEGDRMRGQNQQAVIDAMIKKVCSSTTILTKFDSILNSLEDAFQTNMDYTKMIELVRMQISDNAQWNVSSISVDGLGSSERTYSMGKTRLYVMIPYSGSVNKAASMIDEVLEGKILTKGNIDLSSYNDFPVVSKGVYETEKPSTTTKEEPKQEENNKNEEEEPQNPTTPEEPKEPTKPENPTKPVDPYSEGSSTTNN